MRAWGSESCFTAQCSLHFPSTGGLSSCQHFNECSGFPPTVSTHPLLHSSPPPRSGCLTTAAAVQECLPYNVTHISKRQSALLLLCKEPVSPRCSLSALSLFFRTRFTERHSLMSHCQLTFPAAANTNCTETPTYSWAPSLPRFPSRILNEQAFIFSVVTKTRQPEKSSWKNNTNGSNVSVAVKGTVHPKS